MAISTSLNYAVGVVVLSRARLHPGASFAAPADADNDGVRAAYHRGAHWQERVKMMRWWSDHLDALRAGARILKFGNGR